MKSPGTASYFEPIEAPHTQTVHRVTDLPGPSDGSYGATNTVARLPLRAQAAFRRKLLALLSLQVLTVGAAVVAVEFACGNGPPLWIHSHIVNDTTVLAVLGISTLALLLLLFVTRDVHPLNWAVLVLFSAAQALCLIAADLALDGHVPLLNWGFAWVCTTLMAAMAGWTHETGRGDRGCGFTWLPAERDDYDEEDGSSQQLWPAYATGGLAFALSCGLLAVLTETVVDWPQWTFETLTISFFAQLVMAFWVVYEVERLHLTTTPGASMGGLLVDVYADVVAAATALAMVVTTCLCVAASEGGSGFAASALEMGADGCCTCLDVAMRTNNIVEPEEQEHS